MGRKKSETFFLLISTIYATKNVTGANSQTIGIVQHYCCPLNSFISIKKDENNEVM